MQVAPALSMTVVVMYEVRMKTIRMSWVKSSCVRSPFYISIKHGFLLGLFYARQQFPESQRFNHCVMDLKITNLGSLVFEVIYTT